MKKYLFLPGGLMVVGALLWAAFTLHWDTTAVTLLVGGLLALTIGVAANWQNVRDWFRDPRGIFVLNSIFSTLLLVAVLGLVNAIASFNALHADLTAAGRNTLTAETRTGLARVDKDVVLKQFGRTRDAAVDELLAAFTNASRRITAAFADVERAPQDARTYGVLRDGTVIVSAGDKWRKVEKPTEPALYQAITQVVQDKETLVCFQTGDGEHGLDDTGAAGLSMWGLSLRAAGYRVDRVAMQQGDVPAACEVLVIAGPATDLAPEAIGRLDAWMANGGRLALMVDPPVPPGLRAWLAPRGIIPGDGLIIETNPAGRQVGAGPESPLALAYFDHPITRGFELATIYDRAVPLTLLKQAQIGIPGPLAGTGDRAFERLNPADTGTAFQEGRDRKGPFLLGVASRVPRGLKEDQAVREGRFVVFGDSDFVSNAQIQRQGNRDFSLRTIAWLAGEQEARVVSLSDRQNRRTSMTEQMRTVMYVVNLGLLPLLPLLAGVVLVIRAKR